MARPTLRTEGGARIGFGVFPRMLWDKPPFRQLEVSYVYRVESKRQWCFVLVNGTRDWLNEEAVMADPSRELLLESIRRNERPDLRSSCDDQMRVAAHKQRGLVPADAYTSEHGEVIPYDPDGPQPVMLSPETRSPFNLARWLVGRLRERKGKGERVRRLVMSADSYADLLYRGHRFVPVATVDAMVFEGLPVSIDESYALREVGCYG